MQSNARPTLLFVEAGAAFAEFEGKHFADSRKDHSMNTAKQQMTKDEAHFAPMEAWDAIAAGYDEFVAPGEAALATAALKLAGLRAGDRFLDVAAGTGGLSLPAARLHAKVMAIDWSPRMIAHLNARIQDERLPDAEGKVMDCHALDFADDTFDLTGSLFGVMLVPDQLRALREMVRVTKPGGRVLLAAYGSPSEFEGLQFFINALRTVSPEFEGLPSDPPPLEFQVADPEVMRQRLTAAGLRNVIVDTTHQEKIELRSGEQLWRWCLGSNPIPGMLVTDLAQADRSAMVSRIDDMIRARLNERGVAVLTAPLNIGIGTK
jgi:ubiquinone/menaquinone biosynthesis C-methylase UbiE